MAAIQEDQVRQALAAVKYPGFSRDIVSFGLIREVRIEGDRVHVLLEHSIEDVETLQTIRTQAQAALDALPGVGRAELELRGKAARRPAPAAPSPGGGPAPSGDPFAGRAPLPGIRSVIAVASAKGGVGKSTVATNLALALAARGHRTALMDADIYGPSLPTMLGVTERPTVTDERRIHPVVKDGVACMSIGFLVPADKAMIWRGPMVMGAVSQFLSDVEWGERDVLVIDLPPGTGDAQLTLVQKVPLSGVIMVTTPQDVALIDVVRGIQMFQETKAPILGVVENMSGFVCPHCGEETEIFGKGGGERTSHRYGVPFLGRIPIEPVVRSSGDEGRPVVVAHPDSASAKAFLALAGQVEDFLQERASDTSGS
jgi:ATP-binding protein involved in chromosome partitioning